MACVGMGIGGGWYSETFKWMAKSKPPLSPIPKSLSTSHVSPQSKSGIHIPHPSPSPSPSPSPHHNYNTTNLYASQCSPLFPVLYCISLNVTSLHFSAFISFSGPSPDHSWKWKYWVTLNLLLLLLLPPPPPATLILHGFSKAGSVSNVCFSALYQFHLVKADTARRFIPKRFRLVEAFGYTVGGFFLASYDESPVGAFDELVVLAGLVHNPPAACAWASRVVVSNKEACDHGRREVGLPSQVATFSKINSAAPLASKSNGFLNMMGVGTRHHSEGCVDVHVSEEAGTDAAADLCSIKLSKDVLFSKLSRWMGPMICVSLPSYSGRTEYNPNLLKYSCDIESRLRMVQPAKVSGPSSPHACRAGEIAELLADDARSLSISVLLSKPILALQFSSLKMQVEAPVVVSHFPETSLETS